MTHCRLPSVRSPWAALGAALLAIGAASAAAQSVELTGTAFTVLYRGPAGAPSALQPWQQQQQQQLQRRQPFGQQGYAAPAAAARPQGLRLVLARGGQELARADFDPHPNGFMFALPLTAAAAPVCLRLIGAGGQPLPVRPAGAGGDAYVFRNPLWEVELVRVGEFQQRQAELQQLDRQLQAERAELQSLLTGQGASADAPCTLGPAGPEPPRPPLALAAAELRAVAGAQCALRWEAVFADQRVDLGRTFEDAGLGADWVQREAQRPHAAAWAALRLGLTQNEFNLVRDAAVKGRAFLEHAEGLRVIGRVQQACRARAGELAAEGLRAWEAERRAAAEAPQRALQACQTRAARIEQIQRGHAAAPAYRQELARRIDQVRESSSPAQQSVRLDDQACRDG